MGASGKEFEDGEAGEEEAVAVGGEVEDDGGGFGLVCYGGCWSGFGWLGDVGEVLRWWFRFGLDVVGSRGKRGVRCR